MNYTMFKGKPPRDGYDDILKVELKSNMVTIYENEARVTDKAKIHKIFSDLKAKGVNTLDDLDKWLE